MVKHFNMFLVFFFHQLQEFSLVRITEILTEGRKPSQTPPPRPKREPRPQSEVTTDAVA